MARKIVQIPDGREVEVSGPKRYVKHMAARLPMGLSVDLDKIVVPTTEIADIAQERYTEFLVASNERAVPDIRDGLKPVHRRILLAFHDNDASATSRHYKSVKIVGDCFAAGTLIDTPSGLRRIEELETGDLVAHPSGGVATITATYANPPKPMVRVRLSDGSALEATPDQLFRVVREDFETAWCPARDLAGHTLVTMRPAVPPLAPGTASARQAYVLGVFVAEGFAVQRSRPADGRVRIHMVDPEPLETIEVWAAEHGVACYRSTRDLSAKGWRNQHVLTLARNDTLRAVALPTSVAKSTPPSILEDRNTWLPFLAGFFDGDGHVGSRVDRRLIELATTSPQLARELRAILSALGIRSRTYGQQRGNETHKELSSIEVTGADATRLASALLPFVRIERKRVRLIAIAAGARRRGTQDSDRLPMGEVWRAFSAAHLGAGWFARASDGGKFRMALDGDGRTELRYGRQANTGVVLADRSFPVSRALADHWDAKLDLIGSGLGERLRALAGMSFVSVDGVDSIPDAPNYDIGVDAADHAFVAEGVVVHNCLGKYHPHGDTSVYDAACKMSQDFALRYPLVDLPGNGGSIDGDGAAAYRYTEMRTTFLGDEMLRDLGNRKANIVDWGGNFTNEFDEPYVLPSRFPQLLCNGILTGIGTGYSAMWLPHNLREIVDAVIAVMDNPSLEAEHLTRWIKGPDFPTGGEVMGLDGFRTALETGKGSITVRAKMAIEEDGRETAIVITEIPWQKTKSGLVEEIATCTVKDKNGRAPIEGIVDVSDQSGKDWRTEMRVVVTLRRDANPKVVANLLYKLTGLQTTFSYNQMAYVDGYPELVSFRGAIDAFIAHQMDVLTRRTTWRRKVAIDELEVQNAYLMADKHENELVPLARKSDGRADLVRRLPTLLPEATARQCEIIAAFPLYRFSHVDTTAVKAKIKELTAEIAEYDRLLASKAAMAELLKTELREIRTKYGDERRTTINLSDNGDIKSIEELIADEPCWLALSKSGLVSRLPASTFRAQKRGGAGINAARSDDDPMVEVLATRTREKVWILTDTGNLFGMRVAELDEVARGARGTNVRKFFTGMTADERVVKLIAAPKGDAGSLVIATRGGKLLRTPVADYGNLNGAGLRAIKLLEGDSIASAFHATDGHLLAVSSDGYVSRYELDKAPSQGRGAQGVVAIALNPGASLVEVLALEDTDSRDVLTVLTNGKGKRSRLAPADYPVKGRGIRGIVGHDLGTAGKGQAVSVAFAAIVADADQVMLTCSTGKVIVIDASEIKRSSRSTAGVIVVNLSASLALAETVTGGTVARSEMAAKPSPKALATKTLAAKAFPAAKTAAKTTATLETTAGRKPKVDQGNLGLE